MEPTLQKYVEITLEVKTTSVFESNVGGNPYWPKSIDYPKDSNRLPLTLLAQINFNEVPKIKNFPNKGVLQFFISGNDKCYSYGCNFYNFEQKDFKVIYHEEIDENVKNLLSESDYRFDKLAGINAHFFST